MTYIPIEKLLRGSQSLYNLVMAGAKRATELAQGAQPLVQTLSKKITTIALEEISEGKVGFDSGLKEDSEKSAKVKDKDSDKESKK